MDIKLSVILKVPRVFTCSASGLKDLLKSECNLKVRNISEGLYRVVFIDGEMTIYKTHNGFADGRHHIVEQSGTDASKWKTTKEFITFDQFKIHYLDEI